MEPEPPAMHDRPNVLLTTFTDVGFQRSVTPTIVRWLYVLGLLTIASSWLTFVAFAIDASDGAAEAIFYLAWSIPGVLVLALVLRLAAEYFLVQFRILDVLQTRLGRDAR